MFIPARCPNTDCPRHLDPGESVFFVRRGSYWPKCRAHPVPRFRCRTCSRGFSRQTFRMDYCDKKPQLNTFAFQLLSSGIGFRQTSRLINLSRRCLELKFRKIARHLGHLNSNLRGPLRAPTTTLQLDEIETYETQRNTRPLTLPVLIERESRFMIAAAAAPIRPRGKMTAARRRAIAEDEARFGPRKDESRSALRRVFEAGAKLSGLLDRIRLQTDEKSSYPGLASAAFGADRLFHETTNSKVARATWNPLFPINHTEAILRDLMGRLRRQSWLVSKQRQYLDLHLQVHMANRNYVCRRFNFDDQSPAQRLGFVSRRIRPTELLSWRQDWGKRSGHPLSRLGNPIEG